MPGKAGKPWRRGMGSTKLVLPNNSKNQAVKISQICGNMVIKYREPAAFRSMPTLTLRFFVCTMDQRGHIEWPANFGDRTKKLLRKLARMNLLKMLQDESGEYPVSQCMRQSLQLASGTVLNLLASANDPPTTDQDA